MDLLQQVQDQVSSGLSDPDSIQKAQTSPTLQAGRVEDSQLEQGLDFEQLCMQGHCTAGWWTSILVSGL